MAYINSEGRVVDNRPWSLGVVQDYFWGVIGFFVCFFRGLFHMDDPSTKGRYGSAGRQTGNPGRRMGGLRGVSGVAPPPCAPGGG